VKSTPVTWQAPCSKRKNAPDAALPTLPLAEALIGPAA
jgi:hypothetical protein